MRETRKLLFKKGDIARQIKDVYEGENPIVTILEDAFEGQFYVRHQHKGSGKITSTDVQTLMPIGDKNQITWSERYGG